MHRAHCRIDLRPKHRLGAAVLAGILLQEYQLVAAFVERDKERQQGRAYI